MPHEDAILDAAFLKKLDRLSLMTRRPFLGQMKGEKRSLKRGSSIQFADYREYQQGDDLRYVDWNAAARLEKMFLKLFIEEEDLYLAILLDSSKSMDFGNPKKLHFAARAAATIGYVALTNYDRVSVQPYAAVLKTPLPMQRGKGGVLPFFKYLNQLHGEGGAGFAESMKRFAMTVKYKGVAVVISDLFDKSWQEGLKSLLARGYQVLLIHTFADEELQPTLRGDLRIIDSENNDMKEMSVTPQLLARYTATLNSFCKDVEDFCTRYEIDYLRAHSSMSFDDLMMNMRRKGIVQ